MHLLISSPLDIPTLQAELGLVADEPGAVAVGHGGHPVTELAIALAETVDRLDLVTLDPGLDRPLTLRRDNVRAFVGPYRPRARSRALDLFAAERGFVANVIRQQRPDVVSAHWTYEYALGAIEASAPTLITIHDWSPAILRYQTDRYRAVRLTMQMLCFRRGRHFAAVSPYIAHKAERIVRQPVPVLPNGLGTPWLNADAAMPSGNLVVAANNGFGRLKNVTALLKAWPDVLRVVPGAHLVLTGDGYGQGGQAAAWAASRGLDKGVDFRGPVSRSDLQHLMSGARLFVHPSREESFGMVVLEAMSLGVPVVGGARSGAVPWLLNGGSGLAVDVRDPQAIALATVSLLEDQQRARRIGERARTAARQRFSVANVRDLYLQRLQEIAGRRS